MRSLLAVCLFLLPAPVLAQGWIEPLPRPRPQPARVERVRTSVTVRITDRVARVQVEEWFRNTGSGLAEGDYLYPLPGEAVFSDFSLLQGEDELKGEPMDAGRARAIYEEIVRRHRDPALIELAGHGLLRARIFPIAAGETRSVTLRYTQVLARAGQAYRFRYVAGTARSDQASASPVTLTLTADAGDAFGKPFSPTHRLRTSREGRRMVVRPDETLRGNVDLFLPLAGEAVGIALATHRVDNEDGYFMLTLSPGRVPGTAAPRDVAVVVDTSGSMSGDKMEQARQALHRLLGTLNPGDRFRLIAFSNRVDAQRADWAAATPEALDQARGWIDRLTPSGGTNIAGALEEAFRVRAGEGRLHVAIVITDGLPTVGETEPERIAARVEANRGEARIFAFGVGHDLHTHLLERVAAAGRGTVDYVEPGADVEEAVGSLAAKISHPILVDLAFGGSPVHLKDVQPGRLPDLFAGEELVVLGRYEAAAADMTGDVTITGMRGGRREQFTARLDFPRRSATGEYIAGLWAARKVGELMRTIRVEGETPARVAEVRALALRHGLITEYTSYLVQEPGIVTNTRGPMPPAAPAAVAVSGESAVASARLAAARRSAQTLADFAAAERVALDRLAATSNERLVAGRRFRLESGVWIDSGHTSAARVVAVEPFSDAYFELLRRLPELKPYFSAFPAVIVSGARVSVRVAPGGRATLTAAEFNSTVSEFRRR